MKQGVNDSMVKANCVLLDLDMEIKLQRRGEKSCMCTQSSPKELNDHRITYGEREREREGERETISKSTTEFISCVTTQTLMDRGNKCTMIKHIKWFYVLCFITRSHN